jgi:hypothetical protein
MECKETKEPKKAKELKEGTQRVQGTLRMRAGNTHTLAEGTSWH